MNKMISSQRRSICLAAIRFSAERLVLADIVIPRAVSKVTSYVEPPRSDLYDATGHLYTGDLSTFFLIYVASMSQYE